MVQGVHQMIVLMSQVAMAVLVVVVEIIQVLPELVLAVTL